MKWITYQSGIWEYGVFCMERVQHMTAKAPSSRCAICDDDDDEFSSFWWQLQMTHNFIQLWAVEKCSEYMSNSIECPSFNAKHEGFDFHSNTTNPHPPSSHTYTHTLHTSNGISQKQLVDFEIDAFNIDSFSLLINESLLHNFAMTLIQICRNLDVPICSCFWPSTHFFR